MNRASRRLTGNVERMRRLGIRPVDFVRAAERGMESRMNIPDEHSNPAGRANRRDPGGSRRGFAVDFVRAFAALQRGWR
jgi:hypothetical protein